MNFLTPLMLLGVLALAIPPLIHLINRREARPTPFPALEFLRRAYRKNARRIKMKQWLLLALRMLLFAALALALARPIWDTSSDQEQTAGRVTRSGAHVVVLDLSYPLAYQARVSGDRLFDLARAHALRSLFDAQGPMGVVLVGSEVRAVTDALTADRQLLAEEVRRVQVGVGVYDLQAGVRVAHQLLRDRPRDEEKFITILSVPSRYAGVTLSAPEALGEVSALTIDLSAALRAQSAEGDESLTTRVAGGATELPLLSDAARARLTNHALIDLKLSPAPRMGEGQWCAEVRVANYSDLPMTLWPIWVEVEGVIKVRGFVNLKPNEVGVKRLYFRPHTPELPEDQSAQAPPSNDGDPQSVSPTEHALKGRVRLAPDALELDDERPFWIEPAPPIKVLALNGDPRPTPQEDELFYLERALAPRVLGRDQVSLLSRPMMSAELPATLLEGVDLIILANLPRPSAALGEQLVAHLERGGGVWLAPGARTDVNAWNSALNQILPRPLRGARYAGDAAASIESRGAARLTEFNADHAILTPFEDLNRSSLTLATVRRYMLFDPEPRPQSEVVITLNEGVPFLMTREIGAGRVALWAGPLDREWSDIVLRPDFVPLAHQITRYLTREERGQLNAIRLGSPLALELNGEGPFWALSPRGTRRLLTRRVTEEVALKEHGWGIDETRELGHHRVVTARGGVTEVERARYDATRDEVSARHFVVHLDPSLSDLRDTPAVSVSASGSGALETDASPTAMIGALSERHELWHLGLMGLFLFTLLEGLALFQRREKLT